MRQAAVALAGVSIGFLVTFTGFVATVDRPGSGPCHLSETPLRRIEAGTRVWVSDRREVIEAWVEVPDASVGAACPPDPYGVDVHVGEPAP